MRLLAIDAASKACSAALLTDDKLAYRNDVSEREHGPILIRMINGLLAEAQISLGDLDALAFGCGPGSFTGVRIAAGITQGLAYASKLPVVAVSDLAMLAQGVMDEAGAGAVAVCCDARMDEAFIGFYERDEPGLARALTADRLVRPAAISLPESSFDWHATGDGWRVFGGLGGRLGIDPAKQQCERLPDARFAIALARAKYLRGEAVTADRALPVYLRGEVAWQTAGP